VGKRQNEQCPSRLCFEIGGAILLLFSTTCSTASASAVGRLVFPPGFLVSCLCRPVFTAGWCGSTFSLVLWVGRDAGTRSPGRRSCISSRKLLCSRQIFISGSWQMTLGVQQLFFGSSHITLPYLAAQSGGIIIDGTKPLRSPETAGKRDGKRWAL
jgi:hypothetical protein